MEELAGLPGGDAVATNQVLYNLTRRGIEYDLLPVVSTRGIPIMAYSPLEQGRLLALARFSVAARLGASATQVALAWVLRRDGGHRHSEGGDRPMCGRIAPRSTSALARRTWPSSIGRFRRRARRLLWRCFEPALPLRGTLVVRGGVYGAGRDSFV